MNYSIAVVGAGPAGASAAIQLKRFGFEVVLYEVNKIGGLIRNANRIENYLGFPNGIDGITMAKLIEKHLGTLKVPIIWELVSCIEETDSKCLVTSSSSVREYDFVVLASGTEAKYAVGIEGLDECADKIYYEIADMPELNDKDITIVGAGDAAFDYALSLAHYNKVRILNRTERIRAIPTLISEAKTINNISYHSNSYLTKLCRKNEKILLNCILEGNSFKLETSVILFAIGREVRKPQLNVDFPSERCFIIGDASRSNGVRQMSVASGDGIELAMKLHQKIEKLR